MQTEVKDAATGVGVAEQIENLSVIHKPGCAAAIWRRSPYEHASNRFCVHRRPLFDPPAIGPIPVPRPQPKAIIARRSVAGSS